MRRAGRSRRADRPGSGARRMLHRRSPVTLRLLAPLRLRWAALPIGGVSYPMFAMRTVCIVGNPQVPPRGARHPLDPIICTDGRAFERMHPPIRVAHGPGGGWHRACGSRGEHLTGWTRKPGREARRRQCSGTPRPRRSGHGRPRRCRRTRSAPTIARSPQTASSRPGRGRPQRDGSDRRVPPLGGTGGRVESAPVLCDASDAAGARWHQSAANSAKWHVARSPVAGSVRAI
jgi:hypothetical protein